MDKKYYTNERNVQIVIALLKAHGIKRVIASPGTTNMTFIGSIQNDPWFEIYSSVDERSAAYLACGLAAETGEPVVISCTGATASRNYMPGLTEAYYRKLPVIAITSHRGEQALGHLYDQQIDRRAIPNDIVVESVTVPLVKKAGDEKFCTIEANKAILATKLNGGGPVHINLYTEYSKDFSVQTIPYVRVINRYSPFDVLPSLPTSGKVAIYVGSHHNFTEQEVKSIDSFCSSNNAVVFCDHTSGYTGKYKVNCHLIASQSQYSSPLLQVELLIHIGEISGTYKVGAKEVWRVSEDGALRDTFDVLTKVFMMPEWAFFDHYTTDVKSDDSYLSSCKAEYKAILEKIKELPFGNLWLAQNSASSIPAHSELHMGIYNSLRSWCFFDLPEGVKGKCNVGGFGIDGGLSSLIGSSLANPQKLYFGVFGDLAFFYDMNVLGNRHVGNNVRIMLINNSRGSEFRLFCHPCAIFGEDADPYMAAAGHYGNQSRTLVKGYAESLGYKYLSASTKEEYFDIMDHFFAPAIGDQPVLLEVFTETQDESDALEMLQKTVQDKQQEFKKVVRKVVPQSLLKAVCKVIK